MLQVEMAATNCWFPRANDPGRRTVPVTRIGLRDDQTRNCQVSRALRATSHLRPPPLDPEVGGGSPCRLRTGGDPHQHCHVMDLYSAVHKRYTESMSKHLVDIDNELLAEATSILGASTMKEAVNRSLESVVLAARRRSHADRLGTMTGLDLDDASVMSGAWR